MTVIILKNSKIQKSFKKYFPCYLLKEMKAWTETHFINAQEKVIDYGSKTIYIYY